MVNIQGVPRHIAIIMDGNGRWAKERNLARSSGHRAGMDRVKEIVQGAVEFGVEFLTLFTFSAENWSRPRKEIEMLMRSLDYFISRQAGELNKNNIRLRVIGRGRRLPEYLQDNISRVEEKTQGNSALMLVVALNYGSRQEIVDAVKKFSSAALKREVDIESLNTELFSRYLYTADMPDPDLLIRTSGEMRLSNFLLWQLSYSELYFSRKYWPDFRKADLKKAIDEYKSRNRRFGGLDVLKKNN